VTAKKKILHKKANKSHILTKKAADRKRNLGQEGQISKADRPVIKKLLPYEF
jgi:ribosomal protein L35